jgi:glutamate-5-semialdehyde dehydrogenase
MMTSATMIEATRARTAASALLAVSEQQRIDALKAIAQQLLVQLDDLLKANRLDVNNAREMGLTSALIDRLTLTEERLRALADSVLAIAEQPAVVGLIEDTITTDDGLKIQKQRVPIGVLAMIFESRPNVVIDCAALAIKSGNAIILKGGKEAAHSNTALFEVVKTAICDLLPQYSVQLLLAREDVQKLLQQRGLIDLVIPRGGEGLVSFVEANAQMPVLAHHKGLCHIYVDKSAELDRVAEVVLNAKVQRPGVCNALETLLLDKQLPEDFVVSLLQQVVAAGVELRISNDCPAVPSAREAKETDWSTEYLDMILSVKMVDGVQAACQHIQNYGSQHTESILATDPEAMAYFQGHVDASAVMLNASTRFNDGGQFQLGAELGISTTKLHAYGPMGAKEMTICRHLVVGNNHIRNS